MLLAERQTGLVRQLEQPVVMLHETVHAGGEVVRALDDSKRCLPADVLRIPMVRRNQGIFRAAIVLRAVQMEERRNGEEGTRIQCTDPGNIDERIHLLVYVP